jgi:hypothetical protein
MIVKRLLTGKHRHFWESFLPALFAGLVFSSACLLLSLLFSGEAAMKLRMLAFSVAVVATAFGLVRGIARQVRNENS